MLNVKVSWCETHNAMQTPQLGKALQGKERDPGQPRGKKKKNLTARSNLQAPSNFPELSFDFNDVNKQGIQMAWTLAADCANDWLLVRISKQEILL